MVPKQVAAIDCQERGFTDVLCLEVRTFHGCLADPKSPNSMTYRMRHRHVMPGTTEGAQRRPARRPPRFNCDDRARRYDDRSPVRPTRFDGPGSEPARLRPKDRLRPANFRRCCRSRRNCNGRARWVSVAGAIPPPSATGPVGTVLPPCLTRWSSWCGSCRSGSCRSGPWWRGSTSHGQRCCRATNARAHSNQRVRRRGHRPRWSESR